MNIYVIQILQFTPVFGSSFDIAIPRGSYFVLEHQPQKCNELPANGIVRWTDIEVEVDNKKISEPVWHAVEESPKCKSKAVVVNSTCVEITWDADAPDPQ